MPRRAIEATITRLRDLPGRAAEVEQLLLCFLSGGHALLVGPPGVAKALMATSLGQALGAHVGHIAGAPDLLPSDLIGSSMLELDDDGVPGFHFFRGPLFAPWVVLSHLHQLPPKSQSALLEAMEDGTATAHAVRHRMPDPFFLAATITTGDESFRYPISTTLLDRFTISCFLETPDEEAEVELARRALNGRDGITPVPLDAPPAAFDAVFWREARLEVARLAVHEACRARVVAFSRDLRELSSLVSGVEARLGPSPRAEQQWLALAKARAWRAGRQAVDCEDLRATARAVLSHRCFAARASGASGRPSAAWWCAFDERLTLRFPP